MTHGNRYQLDISLGPISDLEIGWLVGLLEGEGNFRYDGKTQRIQLKTTDEDIIYKYVDLIKRLTRQELHINRYADMKNRNYKEYYQSVIMGNKARAIMKLVVCYMGKRRRQQIWQALNEFKPKTIIGVDLTALVLSHNKSL
jgi:hypothetical protein